MHKYLVEEYVQGFRFDILARFRTVVEAESFTEAFATAADQHKETWEPAFGISELQETIPDVLWEAADGSMVMIQVRRLP